MINLCTRILSLYLYNLIIELQILKITLIDCWNIRGHSAHAVCVHLSLSIRLYRDFDINVQICSKVSSFLHFSVERNVQADMLFADRFVLRRDDKLQKHCSLLRIVRYYIVS